MKIQFLRKLTISIAFISCVVLFLVLSRSWTNTDGKYSSEADENNMKNTERNAEKPENRSDFDILMHFVHHLETKCRSMVILGGHKYGGGTEIDGDKVICLEPARKLVEPCIVYSFGVNNEWSFEVAIQKKYGCKVYAFDPSMDAEDHLHSTDIWFYRMGISNNDKDRVYAKKIWKMNTFEGIKKKLGHANKQTIDVVKMDIEGSEFSVLENMLGTGMLKSVNHLCVEIHLTSVPGQWKRVYRMLKRIEDEAGLHLFSTRNNTIAGYGNVPGEKNRKEYLLFEVAWFRY